MGAVKMSEKKSDSVKKKSSFKVLKLGLYVVLIIILVSGTIFAAVKIAGLQNLDDTSKLDRFTKQITEQNKRLTELEHLSASVSTNTQQLASTAHALSVLSERFNQLYEEVGNNKIEQMRDNLLKFDRRITGLEELKSTEALILSVALLIKENVIYHRPFVEEANILAELNQQNEKNLPEINVIEQYKNTNLMDNEQLAQRFSQIMDDFSFSQQNENEQEKESTFSKSIKMIKDTVSGMHFDRVVVLKKEKKTEHQKQLLKTLSDMVKTYDYSNALNFIAQNSEFTTVDNKDFTTWQNAVKDKLIFDAAISKLIANQLKVLREDIKNTDLKVHINAESFEQEKTQKEDEAVSAEEKETNG